jgi:hypothetical protein
MATRGPCRRADAFAKPLTLADCLRQTRRLRGTVAAPDVSLADAAGALADPNGTVAMPNGSSLGAEDSMPRS